MGDDRRARDAEQLWQAWRSGEVLDGIDADVRPRDLDQGYAVQRALDGLAGPSAGWKIAATSEAGQAHLGVPGPCSGGSMRSRCGSAARRCRWVRCGCAQQPEFAFRFGRDLAPGDRTHAGGGSRRRRSRGAGDRGFRLALRRLQCRWGSAARGGRDVRHFVLGRSIDWRGLDLPRRRARMLRGGQEASAGSGASVMGDPADALTWMANEVLGRGWSLRAGEVVLTGASALPIDIDAGHAVVAEFDGLRAAEVGFVA